MRIVFAGTPAPAVPSLRALAASAHEVVGVVTRADAPIGRKRVLTPSPVAQAAGELGLPIIKADRLDAAATEEITALGADLGVIVAYGGLVREPLLSTPTHGWINLHFSLLPRWRGAAPVQRALIAGDRTTGAAVFQLVPQLDAGDVYAQLRYDIPRGATAGEVLDALDLEDPADAVLDRYRGTTPEPGAHVVVDGQRLKVLAALRGPDEPLDPGAFAAVGRDILLGTGEGTLLVKTVQPAGKGPMAAADWWRGLRGGSPRAELGAQRR